MIGSAVSQQERRLAQCEAVAPAFTKIKATGYPLPLFGYDLDAKPDVVEVLERMYGEQGRQIIHLDFATFERIGKRILELQELVRQNALVAPWEAATRTEIEREQHGEPPVRGAEEEAMPEGRSSND